METSKSEFCQGAWAVALKYEMKKKEKKPHMTTYQVIPPMLHLQKSKGNSELSNIGEA